MHYKKKLPIFTQQGKKMAKTRGIAKKLSFYVLKETDKRMAIHDPNRKKIDRKWRNKRNVNSSWILFDPDDIFMVDWFPWKDLGLE